MYNCIICRYHEIATKGNNRSMFEARLIENITEQLAGIEGIDPQRIRGRIFVRKKGAVPFNGNEIGLIKERLPKVFGLESFSPALECAPEREAIFGLVEKSAPSIFSAHFEEKSGKVSFRIRARRSDKSFPLRSKEIELESASIIGRLFGEERLEVDLMDADITVGIEVRERNAFVYYEVCDAPGGLPVGSNSPVLSLLSGGIDSPVACHMVMGRGCHVDFLTFHSHPYTPMDSVEKVKRIVRALNSYQRMGRLYSCNLAELQKMIRDMCTPKFRTVLYRRMMLRVAERLCMKKGYMAIVTGESVGQVASQTVVNMNTIDAACGMLVLRPLAALDKNESIARARKIGTYDISIEQVPDSCTVFAPPAPAVAAKLPLVERDEERLGNWESVLQRICDGIEIFDGLTPE